MLGAVTDDCDRFVCLTPDRFTAAVSKYFLRAPQYEFGEKLAVILDNAPYFIAKDLKKQAAGRPPPVDQEVSRWYPVEAACLQSAQRC